MAKGYKQKGGVTNRMPQPTKLGMKDSVDLGERMKFYSSIGHGAQPSIKDNTVFLVPDRTWILFVARAGESTPKIKPTIDPILDDFRYLRSKGEQSPYCEADVSPRSADETVKEWHQRIFNCMESGDLFKSLLYNSSNPKETSKMSIYQPGDLVQNIKLLFYNEHPPWDPVGFWELPLRKEDHLDILKRGRATYQTRMLKFKEENLPILEKTVSLIDPKDKPKLDTVIDFFRRQDSMTNEEIEKIHDELDETIRYLVSYYPKFKIAYDAFSEQQYLVGDLLKQDQSIFDSLQNNRLKYFRDAVKITRQTTLYDLLYREGAIAAKILLNATKSPPIYGDSYRFIIIDMCRKSMDILPSPLRLTRTLSFSGREVLNRPSEAICFRTLLQMNKEGFQELLRKKGENAALRSLLNGEEVNINLFEEVYTGEAFQNELLPRNLDPILRYHIFNQGDIALLYNPGEPTFGPLPTIIRNINTSSGIKYSVLEPESENVFEGIDARLLWKSQEDIDEFMETYQKNIQKIKSYGEKVMKQRELQNVLTKKQIEYQKELEVARQKQLAENEALRAEDQKAKMAAEEIAKTKFAADVKGQASKIEALPEDKKKLIVYRKKVWIHLPSDPKFHHRYGYVSGVGAKKNTGELLVALDMQLFGGDPANFPKKKAFPPSVLQEGLNPINAAKSKGGYRKTRRTKNKRRGKKTRRV